MTPIKEWWPRTRDFFRDVWAEVKKVSWPGRPEVFGTTVVVIVACFLFGFYLFLVDSGLSKLVDLLFRKTGVVRS
jgi:preprotein translocase subunit SecE